MDAKDFAADDRSTTLDEMLDQSRRQPLVMGVALHPYIVGQPYRLRHLRRALSHLARSARPRRSLVHHAGRDLRPHGRAGQSGRRRSTIFDNGEVGAWVPHGRFVKAGAASGPLAGLAFRGQGPVRRRRPRHRRRQPDLAGDARGGHATRRWSRSCWAAAPRCVGKLVTDELAYSLHGDNLHYGAPVNAPAPDRVTGGSSSGSAAAVAAGSSTSRSAPTPAAARACRPAIAACSGCGRRTACCP